MPATIFDKPIFPGAKIVSAEVTVTNTSGSYSQSFNDDRISASMRAFQIEIDDPSIFNDKISITTANGSFTIACNSVAGETTINIGFLKIADDPTAVTSTEFTILNNRIGDLDDLETTDQTSMVDAVNEVVGSVSSNSQAIANIAETPPKLTVTPVSGVTIESSECYSVGKLVVGSIRVASSNMASGGEIITGLPKGKTTLATNYSFASCSVNKTDAAFTLANLQDGHAAVIAAVNIQQGTYTISFSYIKD